MRDNFKAMIGDKSKEELAHHLMNLLAIIHRDGGHFVSDHGIDQGVERASKICVENNHIRDRVTNLTREVVSLG